MISDPRRMGRLRPVGANVWNYFKWFDIGTHTLLDAAGHLNGLIEKCAGGLPLVDAQASFRGVAGTDDLEIESFISHFGSKSFTVTHNIWNGGDVAVEGKVRIWGLFDREDDTADGRRDPGRFQTEVRVSRTGMASHKSSARSSDRRGSIDMGMLPDLIGFNHDGASGAVPTFQRYSRTGRYICAPFRDAAADRSQTSARRGARRCARPVDAGTDHRPVGGAVVRHVSPTDRRSHALQ